MTDTLPLWSIISTSSQDAHTLGESIASHFNHDSEAIRKFIKATEANALIAVRKHNGS